MAFTNPEYPITCNIWTTPTFPTVGAPRVTGAKCNLAWGRRVSSMSTGGTTDAGVLVTTFTLLMESTTDIRGRSSSTAQDVVEVPSGSGRFYKCETADYIGLGFDNVHKGAVLIQIHPFKTPDT